jgi:phosphatidate cytidylyltransferase
LGAEKQKSKKMKLNLFYIILLFSVFGGVGTYLAGRKQNLLERKKSWLKYCTYFIIIILLFACVCFTVKKFSWICGLIVVAGLVEIISLQKRNPQKRNVFYVILLVYVLISTGFYFFGNLSQSILLFTLFAVCTFDAFCQIMGQLLGKNKICPKLSPNKTYEGLLGGFFMSVSTSLIIGKILEFTIFNTLIIGFFICVFSFTGDIAASWIKRKYDVKDFSSALPGQGGFLDRFDSLMTTGAFVYLLHLIIIIV